MRQRLLYLVIMLALIVGMVPGIVLARDGAVLSATPPGPVEYNVMGASETFIMATGNSTNVWQFFPHDDLNWDPSMAVVATDKMSATVTAQSCGAVGVQVTFNGTIYYGEKKWGEIYSTEIESAGSTQMQWSEYYKEWTGSGNVTDLVIGKFRFNWESSPEWVLNEADGAVVYWYLFQGTAEPRLFLLNRLDKGATLKAELDALILGGYGAKHVVFSDSGLTTTTSVSGDDGITGETTVDFKADAEECVRIIALATYPNQPPQYLVRPEFTSWNFWTQELEKVPQVRWAGEKIVLEKYWGTDFVSEDGNEYAVHYELEQGSPGVLETVTPFFFNLDNDATSVWTVIDKDGVSRCILTSEKPGECDVTTSLYEFPDDNGLDEGELINQHGFVVFFLKLESITMTKVDGERYDHNSGVWVPGNPVIDQPDPLYSDVDEPDGQMIAEDTEKEANVSADDLLRVRVRGWFMGDDLSIREKGYCDVNGNGKLDMYDYVLPEGRWVLPDDWEYLAGSAWNEFRINWDIMNNPAIPDIVGLTPLGPYGTDLLGTVAEYPVIGPYSSLDGNPGLPYTSLDYLVGPLDDVATNRNTRVPNGQLNWFDCPMPPAKVTFEIADGPGFFKPADKAEIYYVPGTLGVLYTNPYYAIEIPANEEIPPFCNNGGYDWDSWGISAPAYGPYYFWQIVNQLINPNPGSAGDGAHPTKVQVYSDNHGEAMVYINGDWNLDLSGWMHEGFIDIEPGVTVGETTVVAYADYPYMRKHPVITSNEVTNTWIWGKEIMILVEQLKGADPDGSGPLPAPPDIMKKTVWALVCDRDRFAVVGEAVIWHVSADGEIVSWLDDPATLPVPPDYGPEGRLGWFNGVAGWIEENANNATTRTRLPTEAEADYLINLFSLPYTHDTFPFAITSVTIYCSARTGVDVRVLLDERVRLDGSAGEGMIIRHAESVDTNFDGELDFSVSNADPCDPIVDLYAGWNLVSFGAANQSVAAATSSIAGKLVSVWYFVNETKEWKAYSPDAPLWANDLTMMCTGKAYFVEVSADCTVLNGHPWWYD